MNEDLQIAAGVVAESDDRFKLKTLEEFERDYIEMVIHMCRGNISKAAEILDVSASTLYRKRAGWMQ